MTNDAWALVVVVTIAFVFYQWGHTNGRAAEHQRLRDLARNAVWKRRGAARVVSGRVVPQRATKAAVDDPEGVIEIRRSKASN